MRGDDAKKVCPNIQLIQVPVARGKADLNLYRNAGSEVCWAQKKSLVTFLSVFRVLFSTQNAEKNYSFNFMAEFVLELHQTCR